MPTKGIDSRPCGGDSEHPFDLSVLSAACSGSVTCRGGQGSGSYLHHPRSRTMWVMLSGCWIVLYSICRSHLISPKHGLGEGEQPLSTCCLKSPEHI